MRHRYEIVQPTEVERRFDDGDVAVAAEALAARNGRLLALRRVLYLPKPSSLGTLGVPDVEALMAGDLRGIGVIMARALHIAREAVWQLRALKAKGDDSRVRRVGHDHMRACGIDEDMIEAWRRDRFLLDSEHSGFYWQTQSFRAAFHDEVRVNWLPGAGEQAQINEHTDMLLGSLTGFARDVVIALRAAALAGNYAWVGTVRQGFALLRALGHLEARGDTVKNHREDSKSFHQVVRLKTLFVGKGYSDQTWVFLPQAHMRADKPSEPEPEPESTDRELIAATEPASWQRLRGRFVDFDEALGVTGVSRATLNILVREGWILGAQQAEGTTRFDGTLLYEWLQNRG